MSVEVIAQVPGSTSVTTHAHEEGAGYFVRDAHLLVVDSFDRNVAVYAPKLWHSAKVVDTKTSQ